MLGQRAGRVVLRYLQARADRARVVADTRPRADGDGALARSRLQSPAPTLGHRHAQPGRLRGALLGSPRSGLTQVSTRPGQDQSEAADFAVVVSVTHDALEDAKRSISTSLPSVGT